MNKQYYLRADIVDTDEQLAQLKEANDELVRRSGIPHHMEVIDRGTSRIVLVSIDYDVHISGEYDEKMALLVQGVLMSVFDRLEEAAYEQMMNSPQGEQAARMAENFFNKTRH